MRLLLPRVLMFGIALVGCDDDGSARAAPPAAATQLGDGMKINLRLQDRTLTATLHDTPSARDFASMLPLTLTLEDYSKTEKISDLPRKLTTQGAPAGAEASVGDIAYYAPWGNLALFYKDFRYSQGLILLGKVDGDADALSGPGPLTVTVELARRAEAKRGE